VAVCAAAAALFVFVRRPEHALLVGSGGAEWIRPDRPYDLVSRKATTETVSFRRSFAIPTGSGDAVLHVQALRSFHVLVNGRSVAEVEADQYPWRYPQSFDLSPYLVPSMNELRIDATNDRGVPALLAWSPGLGLASHADWEARDPSGVWKPATTAREARHHPVSNSYPSAWLGLSTKIGLLVAAFALGVGAFFLYSRWLASAADSRWRLRASHVRWLALAALSVLVVHNLTTVNIESGFDGPQHFDYIRYLLIEHRVPLANEGWQFFQPPLFYLLAAPPYLAISFLASEPIARLSMRLLVLACGLGLIEMVYRSARAAFPRREDLQMIATAAGGFLPVTVYMSHYVSNEPLAAVLTAALVTSAFRLLTEPPRQVERWSFLLGVLFGLALLAKVTVALLLPLLVAVIVRAANRWGRGPRDTIGHLTRFFLASGAVAGWYFLRNWIAMGTPYIGGWDPARGGAWNQDPGYRVPEDILTFGEALRYPIYAGLSSLWDGIYSSFWLDGYLGSATWYLGAPPWNYAFAVACALLAVPLTAAGAAGALRSLRIPRDATQEVVLFSATAVALYLGALFSLFLALPVYSTVKASYTMGLAPCYGVLFAWGFDLLPRRRAVHAAVAGYLTAWFVFVFRAYFT
jgi:4-amino-4-deoxy-L-arabinose transferase-like glycosyltransferase